MALCPCMTFCMQGVNGKLFYSCHGDGDDDEEIKNDNPILLYR